MIICDSREKANGHVINYFERCGIPFIIQKLDTGDYMASDKMDVSVDRKKNLDELLANLCSKDSSRFWREIRRAKEHKIKLIILCEHGGKYKSIKDVSAFESKYSKVTGKQLQDKMYRCHIAYGVEFLFCDKRNTGSKIIELLYHDKG